MKKLLCAYLATVCFAQFAWSQTGTNTASQRPPPATLEALRQRISELIEAPRYAAALWGVKIVSLDSGKTIFEHDANKLFCPASNSKLYTMAMALDRLGPDYRIKTSLYAPTKPDGQGVIRGDLIVYGRGDPTISGEYNGGNVMKALEPFVAALTNAGVREITGNLVGDESYFHGPPFGSGWSWSDLEDEYGAEISALTINSNTVQLVARPGDTPGAPARLAFDPPTDYLVLSNRAETSARGTRRNLKIYHPLAENTIYVSGSIPVDEPASSDDVTVHNPAAFFVSLLKTALAEHGIKVGGEARSVNWLAREAQPVDLKEWVEIGSVSSRPFRDIIVSVQKPSQNLYTDMLLEYIGAQNGRDSRLTSEESGIIELNHFLGEIGVKRGETLFQDGSGLSRDNLTTPNATVTLLTHMSRDKNFEFYYKSLPIAGVDGTLRRRFKGTPVEGNLRAKTGTLHWANSLSGYLTNAAGEHLILSIMLNRYQNYDRDRSKTADMDAIAQLVAGFKVATAKSP